MTVWKPTSEPGLCSDGRDEYCRSPIAPESVHVEGSRISRAAAMHQPELVERADPADVAPQARAVVARSEQAGDGVVVVLACG